ncbi:hypothetical protein BRADI_1g38321v3, partial [Brachypodium distachyon]
LHASVFHFSSALLSQPLTPLGGWVPRRRPCYSRRSSVERPCVRRRRRSCCTDAPAAQSPVLAAPSPVPSVPLRRPPSPPPCARLRRCPCCAFAILPTLILPSTSTASVIAAPAAPSPPSTRAEKVSGGNFVRWM